MSSRINLEGVHFKGNFLKNPKTAKADLRELEECPAQSTEMEARLIRRAVAPFDLWVLHHDLKSGLFIARGQDEGGNSGIIGVTKDNRFYEDIQFDKCYLRGDLFFLDDKHSSERNFRRIFYFGVIRKRLDQPINGEGSYFPYGMNETQGGFWEMDSV